MSTRQLTALAATLVFGVLMFGALAVAGTRWIPVRTFALGAPNQATVATVKGGRQVCEGDVVSEGDFDQVGLFGNSNQPNGEVDVRVLDATGRVLSRGTSYPATFPAEFYVPLERSVPGGQPTKICVRGRSKEGLSLLGSPAVTPATTMSGSHGRSEFSLVLRRGSGQSFLSSLPRAFSRASLWRPAWIGAWTYWALLGLICAGVLIAAGAVVSAAGDDDAAEAHPASQPPSDANTPRQ